MVGVVVIGVLKAFSISSNPFLISDVLSKAYEKNYKTEDVEIIIKTLEAHTGSAAFFNRIGFSGLSLGTIASAFLLLAFGLVGLSNGWILHSDFETFMDLAKLLFGAFVGSFANRISE